jgi:DNA/RNA-binding domain of Phe-tRNA-synthetase-like protein
MITESTRNILIVIYAPAGAADKSIDIAMAQLSERLSQFTGARVSHSGICL